MAKTPEDTALAAVAKAILDQQKAKEKLDAAAEKWASATTAHHRAEKTTKWAASHPDLPEDFDLDTFRAETLEPFDDSDVEDDRELEVESGEDDISPDQLEVPDDASELDVDDPFGDDEPVAETPKSRSRR